MRVYGRRPHFVSLIVFSLGWGLCVFFLTLSVNASAAGVTYQTVRVGPASYVTNGISAPVTVNVAPPGGVARYQQVVPVASPSTLGKLGRSLVRGGGIGLAVTGVIEGLGYLIDQATGQITKTVVYNTVESGAPYVNGLNSTSIGTKLEYNDPDAWCASRTQTYCAWEITTGTSWQGVAWNCPAGTYSQNSLETVWNRRCYETQYLTQSEQQEPIDSGDEAIIDSGLWSSLTLSQKAAILKAAISIGWPRGEVDSNNYPINPLTSPNSTVQQLYNMWPELRADFQNMLNAEIAAYLASLDPEFTPSPDEQVIVDQGTTTAPGGDLMVDLPPFCEWATWLCDPFVPEAHPDVPVLDIETPTYDSGLPSSATCPAPYQLVTGFGTWEITFQFACDMATAIRTPLIAIAYLMAGFIVVGVRR